MTEKKPCEVFVYLCEQNQSVPQFGNVSKGKSSFYSFDTFANSVHQRGKPGSLERLRVGEKAAGMSPIRDPFFSSSLTPWRSLRDLTKMSTSDSSVNNFDVCKDFAGSTNNIDTDCVSPRVSSNSLASIQVDSLDLADPVLGTAFAQDSHSSPKSLALIRQNLENVGTIYTQKKGTHSNVNKYKPALTFSRSTSCPLVSPAFQVRCRENQKGNNRESHQHKEQVKQLKDDDIFNRAQPEASETLRISDSNDKPKSPKLQESLRDNHSTKTAQKAMSNKTDSPLNDEKNAKKSLQSSKSLARSKCMQWLNSLDEDD